MVRLVLGMGLRTVDPAGAYVNLREALDLQEQLRDRIVDPDRRIDAGVRITEVYDRTIALLATHTGPAAPGWPDRPLATAFDLAERARARVQLQTLGQDLPLPTGPDLADLAAREREAIDALRAVQSPAAPAAAPATATAVEDVRAARERLHAVWDDLAAHGPAGQEYAHLRRGVPLTFPEVQALLTEPSGVPA